MVVRFGGYHDLLVGVNRGGVLDLDGCYFVYVFKFVLGGDNLMNVGDTIKIEKCEQCSVIIGKTAKIKKRIPSEPGIVGGLILNFGRGRPQTSRPKIISFDDVSLVVTE